MKMNTKAVEAAANRLSEKIGRWSKWSAKNCRYTREMIDWSSQTLPYFEEKLRQAGFSDADLKSIYEFCGLTRPQNIT